MNERKYLSPKKYTQIGATIIVQKVLIALMYYNT